MLVSALSYGNWVTHGSQIEEDAATACVKAALDAGITTFDTADVYALGPGRVGARPGALKGVDRDSIEIFTKVYWPTGPNPNNRGLSRKHIMESLRRVARAPADRPRRPATRRTATTSRPRSRRRCARSTTSSARARCTTSACRSGRPTRSHDALRIADEMGFDRIVSNQPQYSLHLAGDRGRGRPALREGGHRPDRLVAAGPGRAHGQVPPRRGRGSGGVAGHGARGRGD